MTKNAQTDERFDAFEQERREANRLNLDYRRPPARIVDGPVVDFHTHVYAGEHLQVFVEAADAYGIGPIVSMSPLRDVPALRERFGGRLSFIAIPDWKKYDDQEQHREQWIRDLAAFREQGSRLCKFWMAPPMRQRHGLSVDHLFLRPVVEAAIELGFEMMIHVADPSVWWRPGGRYANDPAIGSKHDQYSQLEWLLEKAAPRRVIGVHMAGTIEEPDFLQGLLDRHPNLLLDTSATKWIVREVARQPERVREFMLRNAERILFGSDLVVSDKFQTFDHYASRYWAHATMWETEYRGESPIADPDADGAPQLAGVKLPPDVLRKIYRENAVAAGFVASDLRVRR